MNFLKDKDFITKSIAWLAWHLPMGLVYWCGIRILAETSASEEYERIALPDIKMASALKFWADLASGKV
jgi:hypothetical protein